MEFRRTIFFYPVILLKVDREEAREVEEKKRLEDAILSFIESTTKEPVSEKAIEILPALAHELIELWKI
nr:MAG TPA: hypothetical protein [Caudoviricetes sp.]